MKTMLSLVLMSAALKAAEPSYQIHEWGTFTTVSGSDGVLLAGLEQEEERLPGFVHAHYGFENGQTPDPMEMRRMMQRYGTAGFSNPGTKGLANRPLAGVTVKMETPVIYFHSPEALHAKVKVDFHGGTISQWYPDRSAGEKLPEPEPTPTPKLEQWQLDFSKTYNGSVEWDVDVLSPEDSKKEILFKPNDTVNWVRARVPEANAVRTAKGETEGYLFYRGLGNFDPGAKITVDRGETLHFDNRTMGKIPYLIAFERMEDGTLRWIEKKGGVAPDGTFDIDEKDFKTEPIGFCKPVYEALKSGLAGCGLTEDESRAMVETWWQSYFEAPGLRVFWVLPHERTDSILPLHISPAPSEITRVLVGRSEVLRPRQEKQWLEMASAAKTGTDHRWENYLSFYRFSKPAQARLSAIQAQASR